MVSSFMRTPLGCVFSYIPAGSAAAKPKLVDPPRRVKFGRQALDFAGFSARIGAKFTLSKYKSLIINNYLTLHLGIYPVSA